MDDIFAVQDDITRSVVGALEPRLHAAENLRLQSRPPESLDAWGCVVRGLWLLGRCTHEDTDHARALLRRAVALSPGYAKAHSVLAFAEARGIFFGGDVGAVLAEAREIARVARDLDDEDPWSWFASGYVECFTSRYDDAIAWYRRAIELNDNFALGHGNMAGRPGLRRPARSGDRGRRAGVEDEPARSLQLFLSALLRGRFFSPPERYAEGAAAEEQALRERPDVPPALRCLAACLVGLGEIDAARQAIARALELAPESSIRRDVHGQVAYARAADRERFADALRRAGLPEG